MVVALLLAAQPRLRLPPPDAGFDYQLGGAYDPAASVGIVDRDRTESPVPGVYNICYLNAFQTQPEEAEAWMRDHPEFLLRDGGELVTDPAWPGEYLLDVSTSAKRAALAEIEGKWIDDCATAGYDAVEPDNLDTYSRFPDLLTDDAAVAFSRLLAERAHRVGLAIGQKNAAGLGSRGRDEAGFDFAVVEECEAYSECDDYTAVYGRHVLEIEYTDSGDGVFERACEARGGDLPIILRDRDVVPEGDPGYHYESC